VTARPGAPEGCRTELMVEDDSDRDSWEKWDEAPDCC
jgi:hypothetical protein